MLPNLFAILQDNPLLPWAWSYQQAYYNRWYREADGQEAAYTAALKRNSRSAEPDLAEQWERFVRCAAASDGTALARALLSVLQLASQPYQQLASAKEQQAELRRSGRLEPLSLEESIQQHQTTVEAARRVQRVLLKYYKNYEVS